MGLNNYSFFLTVAFAGFTFAGSRFSRPISHDFLLHKINLFLNLSKLDTKQYKYSLHFTFLCWLWFAACLLTYRLYPIDYLQLPWLISDTLFYFFFCFLSLVACVRRCICFHDKKESVKPFDELM